VHHCGGLHEGIDFTIKHCSCGKHSIDKETEIGHAADENLELKDVKVRFTEKCPDGGWHIESGERI